MVTAGSNNILLDVYACLDQISKYISHLVCITRWDIFANLNGCLCNGWGLTNIFLLEAIKREHNSLSIYFSLQYTTLYIIVQILYTVVSK